MFVFQDESEAAIYHRRLMDPRSHFCVFRVAGCCARGFVDVKNSQDQVAAFLSPHSHPPPLLAWNVFVFLGNKACSYLQNNYLYISFQLRSRNGPIFNVASGALSWQRVVRGMGKMAQLALLPSVARSRGGIWWDQWGQTAPFGFLICVPTALLEQRS